MAMAQSSTHDAHRPTERVALITGASRGLGYTVAEFLARQRWTLILTARHEGPLLKAVKRLQAAGASITAVPGDVTQEQHRRRAPPRRSSRPPDQQRLRTGCVPVPGARGIPA